MRIKQIVIKDSPSFKNLTLEFSNKLNVISGASGAGKSVFFASLLALFGLRDCNANVIEGILEGEVELEEYLEEDELSIQILKKDKTRYFINHQSSSKKRLGEIFSPHIKALSHKNSNELQSDFLLKILDEIIGDVKHTQALKQYSQSFCELENMQAELQKIQAEEKNLSELREFALFEIEKISSLNPKEGEYEELLEVKKMLSKKEKIQSLGMEALGILEQMGRVGVFLEMMEKKIEGYDELLLEVEACVRGEMERLEHLAEISPEEILDRLSKLSSLISRYGSIGEALAYLKQQECKLEGFDQIGERKKELEKKIEQSKLELTGLANEISQRRQNSLSILQEKIASFASLLLLNGVNLTLHNVPMQKNGSDELEISLKDSKISTLSSGEYNRLRLSVLAAEQRSDSGVLLLDEIDANLSGEESEGVAKVLQSLSTSYQIFAISHQPHLPSLADSHFLVQKQQEGSVMSELDEEGRVREIARMISGSNLSQEAIDFARKKLQKP